MRLALAFLFVLFASTGLAQARQATTYAGTLGKLDIIVELSDADEAGTFVGRYAYRSKGIDIPLHGKTLAKGRLQLGEEQPCTEALCKDGAGELVTTAPIGAEWTLKPAKDGKQLKGQWREKKSGKTLPITLEEKARRDMAEGYDGLEGLDPTYQPAEGSPPVISEADYPYDFLKTAGGLTKGEVIAVGDSAYRLDLDPRVAIQYPTVTRLGSEDPTSLNAYLRQQRLQFSLSSYACLSKAYLGFAWDGQTTEPGNGYGGDVNVEVEHLTPRLMGILEGGSFFCGGAHPNNFTTHRLVDARTGEALMPETLLRDWAATDADGNVVDPAKVEDQTAITFGPTAALVKYVGDHREKFDAATEADCGIDDLVRSNLGVYFTQTDMVLTLRDLPHVIFACTNDLVRIPLKDARPLLTEAGARYFQALDQ